MFTMAFSLNKLKNILNSNKDSQLAGSGSLEPEIGFKLALQPVSKYLYVTVIGARHLPSFFGISRAHGYLVKVGNLLLIQCTKKPLKWSMSTAYLSRKLLEFGLLAYQLFSKFG